MLKKVLMLVMMVFMFTNVVSAASLSKSEPVEVKTDGLLCFDPGGLFNLEDTLTAEDRWNSSFITTPDVNLLSTIPYMFKRYSWRWAEFSDFEVGKTYPLQTKNYRDHGLPPEWRGFKKYYVTVLGIGLIEKNDGSGDAVLVIRGKINDQINIFLSYGCYETDRESCVVLVDCQIGIEPDSAYWIAKSINASRSINLEDYAFFNINDYKNDPFDPISCEDIYDGPMLSVATYNSQEMREKMKFAEGGLTRIRTGIDTLDVGKEYCVKFNDFSEKPRRPLGFTGVYFGDYVFQGCHRAIFKVGNKTYALFSVIWGKNIWADITKVVYK